jgi:transcription elongation factor Elf1
MMEATKRAKTALHSEALERWIDTKANGQHHVFRMRYVCPHCGTVWHQDITEDPVAFGNVPLVDRRNLGRAMLCGTCEAKSRMVLGSVAVDMETRYVLDKDELYASLGKLYTDHNMGWVMVKPMGPYSGDPRTLLDEKAQQAKAINFVEMGGGRFQRRAGVTLSDAWALGWVQGDIPEPKTAGSSRRRMK